MTCDPAKDPNCSPSRQGNGELIPTPPLPPCATAYMRCVAGPEPTDSVAQHAIRSPDIGSLARPSRKTGYASGRAGVKDGRWLSTIISSLLIILS